MFQSLTVGVVVPAFNEELLITKTLESMPSFVDSIIVVNDGSRDRTAEIVAELAARDSRIVLVNHEGNRGLGQALITGYCKARELRCGVVSVMAGDAQMAPEDLEAVIQPIADGVADYVKGNRLLHREVINRMPRHRFIGNAGLTLLTKFATGYWHSMDPQCGYTAMSLKALEKIPIETMIKGYGYNAHILYMMNLENLKVTDVKIEPVYGDEKSKIRLGSYIPKVSKLLTRLFFSRIVYKYVLRDFHPLFLFYAFSLFNFLVIFAPLSVRFWYLFLKMGVVPGTTLILLSFAFLFGFMSLFFGIWLDMEDNKRLWYRA